ncbi:MAG: phage portal protein [Clostridium sp.]|uniref:phage portal protein n=1 Tax=Clostridia TaxID=186801 RepID=UPI003F3A7530
MENIDIAKQLYKTFQAKQADSQKRWSYYCGKSDIDSTYSKSNLGNNRKVKANMIKKLLNEEVAFGCVNDITLVLKQSLDDILNNVEINEENKEIKFINAIMNNNDSNINAELMKNLLLFGEAMELYYTDSVDDITKIFKVKELNSLNCCVNLDNNNEVINAIYVVNVINPDGSKGIQIQYFDNTNITTYDDKWNQISENQHYFGVTPLGYCRLIDGAISTLFTDLKELQDNMENILSDLANEIGDSRLSYLIIRNMGLSKQEIEQNFTDENGIINFAGVSQKVISNFKDNGILLIEDSKDSEIKAEYITKNITVEAHKVFLEKCLDLSYQISQHINLNDKPSSNTSGVALMIRIIALRNKVKIQQNCMTQAIRKRISCMFYRLNQSKNLLLDSGRVGIKYTIAVPSDDVAITDIINKLYGQGLLTGETALSQLSFINDGKEEYQKAQQELMDRNRDNENLVGGIDG